MSFIRSRILLTGALFIALTFSGFAQFTGGDGSGSVLNGLTSATCPLVTYPAIFAGGQEDGSSLAGVTQSACSVISLPAIFSGGQESGLTLAGVTQSSCALVVLPSIFSGGQDDGYSETGVTQSFCSSPPLPNIYAGGVGSNESSFQLNAGCAPLADFIADDLTICEGDTVLFTDMSSGGPTTWSWSFPGGDPASSSAQNPTVVYNTAGVYNVSLSITSPGGNSSITKTNYITVGAPPIVSVSSIADMCDNDAAYTLSEGSPVGGTYSGTGVSAGVFNPGTAGSGVHVINYNYTDGGGCSNSATTDIEVHPSYSFSETDEICMGDTYNWHGTNYTAAGTYFANYSSVNGCDSNYMLTLSVHPIYSFSENHVMCAGEVYNWQGTNYTMPGTYIVPYTTVHGCDSTYTLTLTLRSVYSYSEDHSICNGENYNWQGSSYTTSGTYHVTYSTIYGCDSTYTLNLTVYPAYFFASAAEICSGDVYHWQGSDYSSGGTFTANYSSIHGCDSIFELVLTVNTVDVSVTVTDPVITANAVADAYQWLDCDNAYAIISGEIASSFTANSNGNYAVMVTQGLCVDTSVCVPIYAVGVQEEGLPGVSLYPNPSGGQFTLELDQDALVEMYNAIGSLVYSNSFVHGTHRISLDLADGVYFVRASGESGSRNLRLVIHK